MRKQIFLNSINFSTSFLLIKFNFFFLKVRTEESTFGIG